MARVYCLPEQRQTLACCSIVFTLHPHKSISRNNVQLIICSISKSTQMDFFVRREFYAHSFFMQCSNQRCANFRPQATQNFRAARDPSPRLGRSGMPTEWFTAMIIVPLDGYIRFYLPASQWTPVALSTYDSQPVIFGVWLHTPSYNQTVVLRTGR